MQITCREVNTGARKLLYLGQAQELLEDELLSHRGNRPGMKIKAVCSPDPLSR